MNKLWISSRWDGKHRLVSWGRNSHDALKPRALRNYIRRNFEWPPMSWHYEWPRTSPGYRPIVKNKPKFQESLQLGLLVRLLNKS